ncbi:MAG: CPBP family intramembrane metalloprotease [Verrucomicrobiaceae bacterium]|nr:MAG: CPBP family intramembrane metalloprotease [Verrucomicrobiaceae bacterium]
MVHSQNPYRAILRRDYPEPFIALLVFVLGIWLWDHYFAKETSYAPGTEAVALIKIDRDLRISEGMAEEPAWLKWLVGVEEPVTVRRNALEAFEKLALDNSISPRGLEAFAIIKAEQDGLPLQEMLGKVLQGQMISDFEETSRQLANHRGTWWEAKLIGSMEENALPGVHWREVYGQDSIRLKTRAVVCAVSVWALGLIGLAFVPRALIRVAKGMRTEPKGYGGAWTLPLGLVVFLVATLAWIGFTMTLDIGIATLPGLHPLMGILLDSAARMLPTLIALGLLFRRPEHVVRVMGLGTKVELRVVLGAFSVLMMVDLVLRSLLGAGGSNDPGGGLSLTEAGTWGLVFAILSACLLAPLAEEVMYRGVLFRSFRNRLGVLPAAVISSAIFASLHFYDGYGLASVGLFGFSCALLYSATGSLTTVIVLHMLYNTAIKLPEWIVYHAPLG